MTTAVLAPSAAAPTLDVIRAKVAAGQRLTLADGRFLFQTPDLWSVCELADSVRRRLHGDTAYYNINRHLNYSNVCALSCKFCEFYRKDGDEGSYTRDLEYVKQQAREAVENGATEMHCVGGLHPKLPFSYYTDLVRTIRQTAQEMGSDLHVKAFTAVEIVHLAKIAKKYRVDDRAAGIRYVLSELKAAGLGSLPGGGAEVFDDRIHDEAYKGKIRSDVWMDVHRIAHELGMNTNATMLYGHIERREERLVHLDMLRRAQDLALSQMGYEASGQENQWGAEDEASGHLGAGEAGDPGLGAPVITLTRKGVPKPLDFASRSEPRPSGSGPKDPVVQGDSSSGAGVPLPDGRGSDRAAARGYFQTIIPLPFFPDGCDLEHLPGPTGLENLRSLAVARLMLDNFPHVKAFWIMQTLPMAQLMLQSGADDIDGTVVWYDITKVGGASTHQEVSVWSLTKAIREAGFQPVERDTLYRRIVRDGKKWSVGV